MEPFVERMVKEYDELNDRVNKLGVFIVWHLQIVLKGKMSIHQQMQYKWKK